jgi:flagellar basal body-associated protein FliL
MAAAMEWGLSMTMTKQKSRSILWMLVLPIPIAIVLAVVGTGVVLPMLMKKDAQTVAMAAVRETAEQFRIIRQYYTQNIVSKVVAHKTMKVSGSTSANFCRRRTPAST